MVSRFSLIYGMELTIPDDHPYCKHDIRVIVLRGTVLFAKINLRSFRLEQDLPTRAKGF
jgi:hypothetical protein